MVNIKRAQNSNGIRPHAYAVTIFLLAILIVLLIKKVSPGITGFTTYNISTQADFDAGTYNNTSYNTTGNFVSLNGTNMTGIYTSKVISIGQPVVLINMSWVEGLPYGEELPDRQRNETELGGMNMSNNIALFRFNSQASTGESNSTGRIYDYSSTNGSRNITKGTGFSLITGGGGKFGGYINNTRPNTSTASYLNITNLTALNADTNVTFVAWVNAYDTSIQLLLRSLVWHAPTTGTSRDFTMYINSTGNMILEFCNPNNNSCFPARSSFNFTRNK